MSCEEDGACYEVLKKMRDDESAQIAESLRDESVEGAEQCDHDGSADALIEMKNAEEDGRCDDGDGEGDRA